MYRSSDLSSVYMSNVWPASNMASFDMAASMTASYSLPGNLPIKRLEPSIHKFVKIAIPTDLERLNQHRRNIERHRKEGSLEKLNAEQNNARRTVQQLKANMREMEKARNQIREEDHQEFDKKVTPVKQEAINAIVQFIALHGQELTPFGEISSGDSTSSEVIGRGANTSSTRQRHTGTICNEEVVPDPIVNTTDTLSDHISQPTSTTEHDGSLQQQIQTHKQMQAAEESWEILRDDLSDLNTVIHEFSTHVNAQQEKVDSIVDNIDQSQLNVREGTTMLAKASKLKAVLLPVGGAIIGGAIGGPIGLYAGMKVGAVAAFGGGAVGFMSGRFLKKKQDKNVSLELETLTNDPVVRTSNSVANTADPSAKKAN